MLGYYKSDQPGVLQPPELGWHDTGDIVSIDTHGFITIQGRAKRFAKIGGEMVSLAITEKLAADVYPEALHAAVVVRDERKGERIILITTQADADRSNLIARATTIQVSPLALPAEIRTITDMPLLGTGKIDYQALQNTIASSL